MSQEPQNDTQPDETGSLPKENNVAKQQEETRPRHNPYADFQFELVAAGINGLTNHVEKIKSDLLNGKSLHPTIEEERLSLPIATQSLLANIERDTLIEAMELSPPYHAERSALGRVQGASPGQGQLGALAQGVQTVQNSMPISNRYFQPVQNVPVNNFQQDLRPFGPNAPVGSGHPHSVVATQPVPGAAQNISNGSGLQPQVPNSRQTEPSQQYFYRALGPYIRPDITIEPSPGGMTLQRWGTYIGNIDGARIYLAARPDLQDHVPDHLTHFVGVAAGINLTPGQSKRFKHADGYFCAPLSPDGEFRPRHVDQICRAGNATKNIGGHLLVCGHAGTNRGPAAVAILFMRLKDWSLNRILRLFESRRLDVRFSRDVAENLVQLERKWLSQKQETILSPSDHLRIPGQHVQRQSSGMGHGQPSNYVPQSQTQRHGPPYPPFMQDGQYESLSPPTAQQHGPVQHPRAYQPHTATPASVVFLPQPPISAQGAGFNANLYGPNPGPTSQPPMSQEAARQDPIPGSRSEQQSPAIFGRSDAPVEIHPSRSSSSDSFNTAPEPSPKSNLNQQQEVEPHSDRIEAPEPTTEQDDIPMADEQSLADSRRQPQPVAAATVEDPPPMTEQPDLRAQPEFLNVPEQASPPDMTQQKSITVLTNPPPTLGTVSQDQLTANLSSTEDVLDFFDFAPTAEPEKLSSTDYHPTTQIWQRSMTNPTILAEEAQEESLNEIREKIFGKLHEGTRNKIRGFLGQTPSEDSREGADTANRRQKQEDRPLVRDQFAVPTLWDITLPQFQPLSPSTPYSVLSPVKMSQQPQHSTDDVDLDSGNNPTNDVDDLLLEFKLNPTANVTINGGKATTKRFLGQGSSSSGNNTYSTATSSQAIRATTTPNVPTPTREPSNKSDEPPQQQVPLFARPPEPNAFKGFGWNEFENIFGLQDPDDITRDLIVFQLNQDEPHSSPYMAEPSPKRRRIDRPPSFQNSLREPDTLSSPAGPSGSQRGDNGPPASGSAAASRTPVPVVSSPSAVHGPSLAATGRIVAAANRGLTETLARMTGSGSNSDTADRRPVQTATGETRPGSSSSTALSRTVAPSTGAIQPVPAAPSGMQVQGDGLRKSESSSTAANRGAVALSTRTTQPGPTSTGAESRASTKRVQPGSGPTPAPRRSGGPSTGIVELGSSSAVPSPRIVEYRTTELDRDSTAASTPHTPSGTQRQDGAQQGQQPESSSAAARRIVVPPSSTGSSLSTTMPQNNGQREPRKRGRPPGSKNKSKDPDAPSTSTSTQSPRPRLSATNSAPNQVPEPEPIPGVAAADQASVLAVRAQQALRYQSFSNEPQQQKSQGRTRRQPQPDDVLLFPNAPNHPNNRGRPRFRPEEYDNPSRIPGSRLPADFDHLAAYPEIWKMYQEQYGPVAEQFGCVPDRLGQSPETAIYVRDDTPATRAPAVPTAVPVREATPDWDMSGVLGADVSMFEEEMYATRRSDMMEWMGTEQFPLPKEVGSRVEGEEEEDLYNE